MYTFENVVFCNTTNWLSLPLDALLDLSLVDKFIFSCISPLVNQNFRFRYITHFIFYDLLTSYPDMDGFTNIMLPRKY